MELEEELMDLKRRLSTSWWTQRDVHKEGSSKASRKENHSGELDGFTKWGFNHG